MLDGSPGSVNRSNLKSMSSRGVLPVTLRGSIVRLEPLQVVHVEGLAAVGLDSELWRLQPRIINSIDDMRSYVDAALDEQLLGSSLPFVIVDQRTDQAIGSSRFMNIALAHRRLEIGATWFARSAQRTGANVESKLLLLTHAFETIGIQKVVFKTEVLNTTSQAAIRGIGASEEGTFRKHLLAEGGRFRDMMYFAIFDVDWPETKERITARLVGRSSQK
jgi:N-acetyltransferase